LDFGSEDLNLLAFLLALLQLFPDDSKKLETLFDFLL